MRIKGGLLGHWSVWTKSAVELLARIHAAVASGAIAGSCSRSTPQVTDCNAAFFDVANDFHGVIAGLPRGAAPAGPAGRHLVPRPEARSLARARRGDRPRLPAYPHLNDDAFVRDNLARWLA